MSFENQELASINMLVAATSQWFTNNKRAREVIAFDFESET